MKTESNKKEPKIVLGGNEAVSHHLLSPPMELVEYMYLDFFVFPPPQKTGVTLPPNTVPGDLAADIPRPLPHLLLPSIPVTIDYMFDLLCEQGFYLSGEWGLLSNIPNLLAEHHRVTELNMVMFLNTLIDKAVDEVQERTGRKPPVI